VTGKPADAGLTSSFAVADTAIACVGTALLAAASLAEQRERRRPTVRLDPGHIGAAMVSERHFRVAGRPAGPGFAPLSRFWPTADGWVRTHANYPWHRTALIEALGVLPEVDQVAAAIRQVPSAEIEDRVVSAGGVAAVVRAAPEWATHEQGQALSLEPLIGHRSIPGAPPRRRPSGGLPAAGVRVLDLTRVIAGPVCTRYLGALGAEVLRIDPPRKPDMEPGSLADTLLAKRSALLNLAALDEVEVLSRLLKHADVVVSGYRPGSLEPFGLAPDQLAEAHPGLVVVQLSAWGHSGPWAQRRGFDSIVQAAAGIAVGEATEAGPGALPCQLLDHGTGYLAAAAALDGLRRQTLEGGTHIRTVSLARTARWLVTNGGGHQSSDGTLGSGNPEQWIVELPGSCAAVAPPGAIDGHELRWPGAPAAYGQDPPLWAPTA
jgi:crotonobetainyl-CoA:carnitine CoA-transferase CaiB-like acyl-CoA transferase